MYCNIMSSIARISSSISEPPVKLMHLSTASLRNRMTWGIDSSILLTVSPSSILLLPHHAKWLLLDLHQQFQKKV
ncbi:unnamed protein product, partial [Vitis vinifera]